MKLNDLNSKFETKYCICESTVADNFNFEYPVDSMYYFLSLLILDRSFFSIDNARYLWKHLPDNINDNGKILFLTILSIQCESVKNLNFPHWGTFLFSKMSRHFQNKAEPSEADLKKISDWLFNNRLSEVKMDNMIHSLLRDLAPYELVDTSDWEQIGLYMEKSIEILEEPKKWQSEEDQKKLNAFKSRTFDL